MSSEHEIRRKTQIRVARKVARSGSPVLTGSSSLTLIHRNCAAQVAYQSCALQSKNVLMDGQSVRHESEGRRHMHWMYLRITGVSCADACVHACARVVRRKLHGEQPTREASKICACASYASPTDKNIPCTRGKWSCLTCRGYACKGATCCLLLLVPDITCLSHMRRVPPVGDRVCEREREKGGGNILRPGAALTVT